MPEFKRIAFFDFDGTITTRDTLPEIIRFQKGTLSLYTGLLRHFPLLLAYKLKIVSNDRAKQKVLRYFFGGMNAGLFQQNCDLFAEERLSRLIRPAALEEINKLKKEKTEVVIVSASAGNWIRKWSDSLELELVSTSLEIKNGLITGRIAGKNCHGEEKVRRIREKWNLNEFDEVYAYGDTEGDRPMLALATKSFFRPFRG
ncbi:MAG TPA: HAD-IB family hydrolase [Puia sp.]